MGNIHGFQSTLCSGGLFKPVPRGQFIQLMFVAHCHWMTASNIVCGTSDFLVGSVQVYDSGRPLRLSTKGKNQICSFLKPTADRVSFDIVDVEGQTNSYDCGVYAIAYATHIIHGLDPVKSKWVVAKESMRKHLYECLLNKKMTPFPTYGPRKGKLIRCISSSTEDIHCICRMPNNPKYEMLVCDVCSRWYHLSCISITSDEAKTISKWHCKKCEGLLDKSDVSPK